MRKDVIMAHIDNQHREGGQTAVRQMSTAFTRVTRVIIRDILGMKSVEGLGGQI
jgi:hypothetical protein